MGGPDILGGWLALAGGLLVAGATLIWFRLLRTVRIPRNRIAFSAAMTLGVGLGVAAFLVGVGWLGGLTAALAIGVGVGFLALGRISGQARPIPAVRPGGRVLDFEASDDQGRPFRLASLAGRPVLLKFFRGHW